MSTMSAEGSIVIDKEIRERLGVEPGWEAVQFLRDGVLEIHFLPPARPGIAAGILAPYMNGPALKDEDALHEATEWAMGEGLKERFGGSKAKDGS